ncbi:MAG: NADH-quinone oxidoreductase subunit NuoB [Candidatus Izimaplasma sp.]|nr:NADH-quinone oxidoreductase subunit NuoB [Candidatus Izimaplasma bacterium]
MISTKYTEKKKFNKQEIDRKWWEVGDYFRRNSLWLLMYCTGCCAIELPPSMTSAYDMERLGMGPMATPRQADILLVSGYLSLKTLRRLIYTYEQMSEPRYVVALGSCPINGGIYHDSHPVINQLDQYIPVDTYVAGCMPNPESVLNGFVDLMEGIKNKTANGWKKYHKNYDWYKKNQFDVLGEVVIDDEFHQ